MSTPRHIARTHRCARRCTTRARQRPAPRPTPPRRGSLYSFAQRIGERLEDARNQATAEATSTYGTDLVPVLAYGR